MRILVTGGTGVIGKPTIERLLERGHRVRLLSRHAERDARQWGDGVEAFQASVGDASSLRGAAEGCDAVLHIAGIVRESPPEVTFEKVNVQGTRNLVEETERAGVERLVFVSSLGAERGTSDYHRSKRAAEEEVRNFGGSWLILRPGNVYGTGDEVISLLLRMVRMFPVIPVVGSGDQPFQPICAEDLAQALVLALERPEPAGEALDVAGAEVTTTREVLDLLEEITDKHPVRVPVPEWLATSGVDVAEALGIEIPVNADQLTMLVEENVIPEGRANALTEVFGITPTPLAEGVACLAQALPEQLPSEGLGPLHRQRYWADIRGSELSAPELLRTVRAEFHDLVPDGLLGVGVERGSAYTLEDGATLTLSIPLRGNIQVRVEEVTEEAVTLVTLQGHPLSGAIRFLTEEVDGTVRFEVRSFTRASDLMDLVGMRTVGQVAQQVTWRSVVEAVVRRSGGEAVDGVRSEEVDLEGEDAQGVERWVEELVQRRQREESEEARGVR